jgi:3-oxoacyl-[acyl-carrier protein] reductase
VARAAHLDLVTEVAEKLGPPTVLVNNAGVIRDNMLFNMTADDWDTVMHVHLRGSFLMSRAAQQHMTAEKFGRIVNLSSTSALGNRGQANYSAAKAGLQGFTKTLALELGKFGVTANAVAPGFIETEMTAATAERMRIPFEDFKAGAAAQIPVGRVGQPEDIAHTVSFLVSEGAGFVSGQVIYVAGWPAVLSAIGEYPYAPAASGRIRVVVCCCRLFFTEVITSETNPAASPRPAVGALTRSQNPASIALVLRCHRAVCQTRAGRPRLTAKLTASCSALCHEPAMMCRPDPRRRRILEPQAAGGCQSRSA